MQTEWLWIPNEKCTVYTVQGNKLAINIFEFNYLSIRFWY